MPRRGVTEDHPLHPGGRGEAEVPKGLNERPLIVDATVELSLGERTSSCDGTLPQPFQDRPRLAESVGVVGAHLRPLGHAAVQFGVDQRRDIDAVHDHILQLAADLDVHQLNTAHPRPGEQRTADPHPAEVYPAEGRVAQAYVLEALSGQVLLTELSHGQHATASSRANPVVRRL